MILSIDTTGPSGSLALGPRIVELSAPDGYGGVLFAEIQRLLDQSGIGLEGVDCFAAAAGPGTFTGVRAGLACAKGLAEVMGKPMCAVSNLAALAEFGTGPLRAVTIDARRGEVYAALYGPEGSIVLPERVTTLEAFRESLPAGDIEWIRYSGPLAGAIAAIAKRSPWVDPAIVDANYLRRTAAELNLAISNPL